MLFDGCTFGTNYGNIGKDIYHNSTSASVVWDDSNFQITCTECVSSCFIQGTLVY
jgi:hypothetical protein